MELSNAASIVIANAIGGNQPHLVNVCAKQLGVSRATIYRHLKEMIANNLIREISEPGKRNKKYEVITHHEVVSFDLEKTPPDEHAIWITHVKPLLPEVPANVLDLIAYGFQEMVNNVFSHSSAAKLIIGVDYHAFNISISILDDGVGIFQKIKEDFQLTDIREAVFELTKGKLTSDKDQHSGEGIFFTSRMMDFFALYSGTLSLIALNLAGKDKKTDWLMEPGLMVDGTQVVLKIRRDSKTTIRDIFDSYAGDEPDYAFKQTIIPVKLLQFEGESLLSRSQAKRLIARFQEFQTVFLDFDGVSIVGQGFADEVFRVFKNEHPKTTLLTRNTNEDVEKMIRHVLRNQK